MKKCIKCRGTVFLPSTYDAEYSFSTPTVVVVEIPCIKCVACGEARLAGADLGAADVAVAGVLADGPPSGAAFRYMRKQLGWRPETLARFFGEDERDVVGWGLQEEPIPLTAWVLLGMLVRERDNPPRNVLNRLTRLLRPKKAPKKMRMTAAAGEEPVVVKGRRCKSCNGCGVTDPGHPDVTCRPCKGTGRVSTSKKRKKRGS